MKQLQISEALFVKLVKFFYSEEIGYDDEELFDLECEIKKRTSEEVGQNFHAELLHKI